MRTRRRFWLRAAMLGALVVGWAAVAAQAQSGIHRIEGVLRFSHGRVSGVRVQLLQQGRRPIQQAITRSEGQFEFTHLHAGDYVVETPDTDRFEASSTDVPLFPIPRNKPFTLRLDVELAPKARPERVAPGTIAADVDLNVPKSARKHYEAGLIARDAGDTDRAVAEFERALRDHPDYYAARLDLGRLLHERQRYEEAEAALKPLLPQHPRRVDPRVELGRVLMALGRRDDASRVLREAVSIEDSAWAPHFYLGWALLEADAAQAVEHLTRALALDAVHAARAHLALARLAEEAGRRAAAIEHLDAFVALAPDAPDAPAARTLAARLRAWDEEEREPPN